jgi:hypothetical protein
MPRKIPRTNFQPEEVNHKPYLNKANQAMQGGKPPVEERKQIEVPDSKGIKHKTTVPVHPTATNQPAMPKKLKKKKMY